MRALDVSICGPAPHDDRYEQNCRPDLNDRQDQGDEAQEAGSGNARSQKAQPGQERLRKRDTDNAAQHVAYGAAGQVQHFLTALTEDSAQERSERIGQMWSGRVEKSRNSDGGYKLQEADNYCSGDA
jgi:hypothetical protein